METKQYLLLAAVVASVLLSACEARAILLNEPATCEALGAERACVGVPLDEGILDTLWTVADTGPGGDPLFTISATESTIVLTFTEFVTENTLNTTGFRLSGLQSMPALIPGEQDVTFLGDFTDLPISRPFVSEDLGSIEWTLLAGADPSTGAIARINLQFVSETASCDFDGNNACDINDIDLLVAEIVAGTNDPTFDLTADGEVTLEDVTDENDGWLRLAGEENLGPGRSYLPADITLDGIVDGLDFIEWNDNKFMNSGLWSLADLNADGVTDGLDFITWNDFKFMEADTAAVPEPTTGVFWVVALMCSAVARRR